MGISLRKLSNKKKKQPKANTMKKPVYTVGIVDDQLNEVALIQRYIVRLPYLELCFAESNPQQALVRMEKERPDILILDILMPEMNGFKLYQALAYKPQVIVCSGAVEYGHQANALAGFVGFMDKWVSFEEFESTILRATVLFDHHHPELTADEVLVVKAAEGYGVKIRVPLAQIRHVEVQDKIVTFYCDDFDRPARMSLDEVEAALPDEHFLRVHQSHLIRVDRVNRIEKTKIGIEGHKTLIPVGRSYIEYVHDRLSGSK